MTVQQEAIRMINSMPDDTVSILVEFLKRMKVNDSHSNAHQAVENIQFRPHKRKLGICTPVRFGDEQKGNRRWIL